MKIFIAYIAHVNISNWKLSATVSLPNSILLETFVLTESIINKIHSSSV